MGITREIKDKSQYFGGSPKEDWALADIEEKEKNYIRYYRDKQGNYHHTAVPRKREYDPYKVELTGRRDGMDFASVIHKKTGKPHPAMLR